MKTILIKRKVLTATATLGELYFDGKLVGYTLEDVVRSDGVKIKGVTAIPKGEYNVTVSMSNRFKKLMIEVLNVPKFTGVRIHGGNTHEDTEGCPLLGSETNWKDRVWNCKAVNERLLNLVQDAIKAGDKVVLRIE